MTGFRLLRKLTPIQQAYGFIGAALCSQYILSALSYFQLLPDIGGKSLNGIVKNSTYMIPGILAIIGAMYFEGFKGLRRIAKSYTQLRFHPLWWVFAGLAMIPILLLSLHGNDLLQQREFTRYFISLPGWDEIKQYSPAFIQVAISDELFWIGFVYSRFIQAGYPITKAALVIGVFWGMNYAPFLFTQFFVSPGLDGSSIVLGWFAITPLYIWLYHKTRSATILIFFNVCMQFAYSSLPILPQLSGDNSGVAMANLVTLCAGLALLRWLANGKAYDFHFFEHPQSKPIKTF